MAGTNFFALGPTNVMVALTDENDNIILAKGTAANLPTSGFAVGGQYMTTDTGARFTNVGTVAVNSFATTAAVSSTNVSSAQILALNATPVTLVPAPPTGKTIIVRSITVKMTTTATAYANGGALEFRYTNAAGTKVTADIAAAVVTAGAGVSFTTTPGIAVTGVINAPIVMDNATAPFITGTGTMVVTVNFDIV